MSSDSGGGSARKTQPNSVPPRSMVMGSIPGGSTGGIPEVACARCRPSTASTALRASTVNGGDAGADHQGRSWVSTWATTSARCAPAMLRAASPTRASTRSGSLALSRPRAEGVQAVQLAAAALQPLEIAGTPDRDVREPDAPIPGL